MKKILAVMACALFILGVGCGNTKTGDQSVVSSSSTTDASASAGQTDGTVTVGGVTYTISPENWEIISEESDAMEYKNKQDSDVGLIVMLSDLSGTAIVDKDTLINTFIEQIEVTAGGTNITSDKGEKNGLPYANITFDYEGQNEEGNTVTMPGLAYVILSDNTAVVVMLAGKEDISPYTEEFANVSNSIIIQ